MRPRYSNDKQRKLLTSWKSWSISPHFPCILPEFGGIRRWWWVWHCYWRGLSWSTPYWTISALFIYSSLVYCSHTLYMWRSRVEIKDYSVAYRIARKFRGVKFSWKLIRLSFLFTDSDPIAIINDVNIITRIKIFVGRDKSTKTTKTAKILSHETF